MQHYDIPSVKLFNFTFLRFFFRLLRRTSFCTFTLPFKSQPNIPFKSTAQFYHRIRFCDSLDIINSII